MSAPHIRPAGRVHAVLGPTNTGKTHYAMERLLAHPSGMIGFPLRLLARENYDRAVRLKGEGRVALITGEEKIVPPNADWLICTVESMPLDRAVDFCAVDEIQMCADPERGHVFTDRMLHMRGTAETVFLGAETIRPVLRRLVPEAEISTRPRLSVLRYAGARKITRLPARSAVVAFSVADVYQLAEQVRRQRGGAAVVLGALSPRTRNAQVEMYQAGEVDYLVATDAIGMGLNMDVDHVAFAGLRKFDGRKHRLLTAAELGQAAGRAGRHMNDGSFGETAEAGLIPPDMVDRIENHDFEPLQKIFWRNPALDFRTLDGLRRTLTHRPEDPALMRAREADDELALARLSRDVDVAARVTGPGRVRLLWDICQIPDFRKVMSDGHARLLKRMFEHLTSPEERLPTDWVAEHVKRLDRPEGDIETLMGRIAGIRTWTYVSFRPDWLADAAHWRERTRAIEDRLSDALHQRLTQRFVDKRAASLVRSLEEKDELIAAVRADGEVLVEGQHVGWLDGFRFRPEHGAADLPGGPHRAVLQAARRALRGEVARRLSRLEQAPHDAIAFEVDEAGRPRPRLLWEGAPVGRIAPGPEVLRPSVQPLKSELLEGEGAARVRARLEAWVQAEAARVLKPLADLEAAEGLSGPAKGLAFRLREGFGSVRRAAAREQVDGLSRDDRKRLKQLGVRIGRESVFLPALLKPRAVGLLAMLWARNADRDVTAPAPGRVSVARGPDAPPDDFLAVCGYVPLGPLALRADIAERLAARAWRLGVKGPFAIDQEMLSIAGAGVDDLGGVLRALGFQAEATVDEAGQPQRRFRPATAKRPAREAKRKARAKPSAGQDKREQKQTPAKRAETSPFAALAALKRPDRG